MPLTTNPHDLDWTTAAARAAPARLRDGDLVTLSGSGRAGPLLPAAPAVAGLITAFWHDPHTSMAQYRSQTDRAAAGWRRCPDRGVVTLRKP